MKCKNANKIRDQLSYYFRELIQNVIDLPGVFDFSWLPDSQILITALAEGSPKLFEYEEMDGKKRLRKLPMQSGNINNLEMTLAVAGSSDCLLTCDNKGFLTEWNIDNSGLQVTKCWQAHDAEIWYVSNDYLNKNLFFTGSDDYSMKIWDMREEPNLPAAIAVDKTGHDAGVCCVISSPWDEFTIASGSYDEKVRLWDRRALREPINVVECGSGAWRLKWNPVNKNLMGVAAMRAGFQIIDLEQGKIIQTESVDDHVAYGIDWHANGISLASCSFYNNQGQFFSFQQ